MSRPARHGIFKHGMRELANKMAVVVDENEVLRSVLLRQMKTWGMDVHVFANREEAAEEMRKAARQGRPYSVAVIDDMIENAPGVALAEEIKSDPAIRELPVIMLVPLAKENDDTVRNAGAVDRFVGKPFFGSALFDAILALLTGDGFAPPTMLKSESHDTLPAKSLPSAVPLEGGNAGASGPRILVAEDNRINQIVVTEILVQNGYRYKIAENGREARDAAAAEPFDLVLMDCQMPVMDGYEAATRIRELERDGLCATKKRLPIVALTANATAEDRQRSREAGMDDYCTKPIDAAKLLDMLGKWLAPDEGP